MDEYISKHEPIEEIKRIYCTSCNSYNGAMCRACEHQDDIDIIEDTKAADVQPVRRGRWIPSGRDNDYNSYCRCSRCSHEIVMYRDSEKKPPNYCDNCGARMTKDGDTNG